MRNQAELHITAVLSPLKGHLHSSVKPQPDHVRLGDEVESESGSKSEPVVVQIKVDTVDKFCVDQDVLRLLAKSNQLLHILHAEQRV